MKNKNNIIKQSYLFISVVLLIMLFRFPSITAGKFDNHIYVDNYTDEKISWKVNWVADHSFDWTYIDPGHEDSTYNHYGGSVAQVTIKSPKGTILVDTAIMFGGYHSCWYVSWGVFKDTDGNFKAVQIGSDKINNPGCAGAGPYVPSEWQKTEDVRVYLLDPKYIKVPCCTKNDEVIEQLFFMNNAPTVIHTTFTHNDSGTKVYKEFDIQPGQLLVAKGHYWNFNVNFSGLPTRIHGGGGWSFPSIGDEHDHLYIISDNYSITHFLGGNRSWGTVDRSKFIEV